MLHGLEIEAPPSRMAASAIRADAAHLLAYRIPVCRLLSGVFLEEPGIPFLKALRSAESIESLVDAGLRFDADFLEAPVAELAEQLAVEYGTLFTASGGFPPIESVRLTGRLKQEPYFAVADAYRKSGFELGKLRHFVFADQLGVELAYVAELMTRCHDAVEECNDDAFRKHERELKRFWAVHLGKWVRGYARLVQRASEHSLYREMARLLEAFADDEIEILGLRIADEDQARTVVPKSEVQVAFNPEEPVCGACPGGAQSVAARLGESHAA
ncbi:MAG TPA: molecular chaperone TorD family protein [Rhodocyclaceae bacterium]